MRLPRALHWTSWLVSLVGAVALLAMMFAWRPAHVWWFWAVYALAWVLAKLDTEISKGWP